MYIYGIILSIIGCIVGSIGKIFLKLSHVKKQNNDLKS